MLGAEALPEVVALFGELVGVGALPLVALEFRFAFVLDVAGVAVVVRVSPEVGVAARGSFKVVAAVEGSAGVVERVCCRLLLRVRLPVLDVGRFVLLRDASSLDDM